MFALKILCNTFKYLYLSLIIYKFRWLAKMVFICVFRVFVLYLWGFLSKKTPQESGLNFVCSGLERIGNSLKIHKSRWLCEALES